MEHMISYVSVPGLKEHPLHSLISALITQTDNVNFTICRMEDFFALSKEEAPDNVPMIFITMPSAKDPEAKIRHPGANTDCT